MQTLSLTMAALLLVSTPAAVNDAATTAYHDAETGVTYRYPAAFQTNPGLATRFANQLAVARSGPDPDKAARAKCVSLPFFAAKQTANGEVGLIFLIRADHKCMGEPADPEDLGGQAQSLAKDILHNFGLPLTEDALNYKLDGHAASFVQGSAEAKAFGDGTMLHAGTVCTLLGQNTLCWLIIDSNHKAMPALMAATVAFEGHEPVPLVPNDMIQAW